MKSRKILFNRVLFCACPLALPAQAASAQASPTCLEYLSGFQQKVEADYAGYKLEVVGRRRTAYDSLLVRLREVARRTDSDECFAVLKSFVMWFDDPHLFVFQSSRLDSVDAVSRREAVANRAVTERTIRADFLRRREDLDPIEGIWTDGTLRVAVLPSGPDRFDAVVLTPDSSSWSIGDVRGTFARSGPDYSLDLIGRNYSVRTLDGFVHKKDLLRISPEMWAREFPVQPQDSGLIDLTDPRRPTLVTRDGTVIVSLPSHSPAYTPVLDSLIGANRVVLQTSPRLIIDLRGNEGGSSFMSNGLLAYVLSADELPERFPERGGAVMLSSPDQISYARRAFGPDTSRFVRTLVERLEFHPGEFVPLVEPGEEAPASKPDSLVYGPTRVAVMIDRGTVSASEVLVLKALRSTRALVIGQHTAGALDYQSTSIVSVVSEGRRWYLGYPTITRDTLLPLDGMRGHGIAPQVEVSWDVIPDPIARVDSLLRNGPPAQRLPQK